ncbi:hypothetical protein ANO11243_087610 [Dothideomycetidae sp. 11243]|nr:hypothetical protein ANO11243_087610 [fungal sp. No.11243]
MQLLLGRLILAALAICHTAAGHLLPIPHHEFHYGNTSNATTLHSDSQHDNTTYTKLFARARWGEAPNLPPDTPPCGLVNLYGKIHGETPPFWLGSPSCKSSVEVLKLITKPWMRYYVRGNEFHMDQHYRKIWFYRMRAVRHKQTMTQYTLLGRPRQVKKYLAKMHRDERHIKEHCYWLEERRRIRERYLDRAFAKGLVKLGPMGSMIGVSPPVPTPPPPRKPPHQHNG